jgi:uncharacterized protein (TIGR03083 family)
MESVEPIETIELFLPLSTELLSVLRTLAPEDWVAPTVCGPWSVKDVAAHLLGGNLGRLWHHRDTPDQPQGARPTYDRLLAMINQSNNEWVHAARRIGPEILIEFLELTDQRLYEHFKRLTPDMPARAAVAWAGNEQSPNWFDIAREYTEKWLHQQHIREAVGRPTLTARRWLHPVLDTFLRGLPHAYRHVDAEDGVVVTIEVAGEAGGEWSLLRRGEGWQLFTGGDPAASARVQIDQDLAWRLFTKGVARELPAPRIRITGDRTLGAAVLELVSIMA